MPLRQASINAQADQKPLPPPPMPFDRTVSEAPIMSASTYASENQCPTTRPHSSSSASFQRPRKRVIWRNKACFIALPIDNEFGKKTTRESYLSPQDMERRLQEWESKGYQTTGFLLGPPSPGSGHNRSEGQSRDVYPDPEDDRRERMERSFRVSIPDRQEWETYVNNLKEEKLRALGVSFGDNDPPRKSPTPSLMSRQGSSQSSVLLTSPALAPQSVHVAPLQPSAQIASNSALHVGKPGVSHFPRFSMGPSFGEQQSKHFPQHIPSPLYGHMPSVSHLASQPASRVTSPNAHGHRLNPLCALPSEALPIQKTPSQTSKSGGREIFHQMRQQQALVHAQQMQQQQQYQNQRQHLLQSNPQPVPNAPLKPKPGSRPTIHPSQTEIASSVPGGQRPKSRESVQQETDEAQIDPQAIEEQVEDQQSLKTEMEGKPADEADALKPNNEVPAFNCKLDGLDLGSDQSSASWLNHLENPQRQQQLDPASKVSTSKLNVNAPEFKYEPRQVGGAKPFAFVGNERSSEASLNLGGSNSDHINLVQNGLPQTSRLNVEAPEFTPGANAPKATLPSRVFSFSASLPTFRTNASASNPSVSEIVSSSDEAKKANPVEAVKKIFGDIKLSDKKSKAIPIVKPDSISVSSDKDSPDSAGQEDESGRITQADGRQKRLRRNLDDGDQVPLFASPNQTPLMNLAGDDRAAYFSRTPSPTSDQAEPTTVDAATDLLEEIIDDLSATEVSDLMKEDESVSGEGKAFEPHAFHDIDDAVNFNAARPPASFPEHNGSHLDPAPDDVARATIDFLDKSPQFKSDIKHALERPLSALHQVPFDDFRSVERIDRVDHAPKSIMDGVRYVEPSYSELDAVMRYHNGDLDHDAEQRLSRFRRRGQSMSPIRSSAPEHQHTSRSPIRRSPWEIEGVSSAAHLSPPANFRSDAPSPSPSRLRGTNQQLPHTDSESVDTSALETIEEISRQIAKNPLDSPSWPARNPIPVHRLNSPGSSPPSDWNDEVSSLDEDKFHSRTAFFDNHVNHVVGSVVQQRLGPLEQAISRIQQSLTAMVNRSTSRRPRSSGPLDIADSDADDEEDAAVLSQARVISPVKDRKYDQLKATINDISVAQRSFAPAAQMSEVIEAIKDLKLSLPQGPAPQADVDNIKTLLEDAIAKQSRGRSAPVTSSSVAAVAEKSQLQISGLESMLKVAEDRANDELKSRRATEDVLADNQRLLRSALQEAAQQRESAELTERTLGEYSTERQEMFQRNAVLERSEEDLQKTVAGLSDKNAALEDTLAEYRLSSDQWRTEIDDARHENKDLRRNILSLKAEIDENNEIRQNLRVKLDGLQQEMSNISNATLSDQLRWQGKEQENNARLEMLGARLEAEARTRERLELEIERLETQEKEAMKARMIIEQTQSTNAQLQDMLAELRSESHKHQNLAAHFEREYHNEKECSTLEINRVRMTMGTDIQAANNHVNIVRADLEAVIGKLDAQLKNVNADVEKAQVQYESALLDAKKIHESALQEVHIAREAALREQQHSHENTLGETKKQYERLLSNALDDRQRSETYFGNRLNLADEKVTHYQERITHLEEKLEIAKSAAHAAVQAAQKNNNALSPPSNRTVHPVTRASDIPEKISPQALRESILVLQEQLQERESRIEQLETEMSAVDRNAPANLKDANVEISWLRELLGVRIDDLEDIIATLSQPSYDREAVKDAAIRLKANLQMEQQEKERAMAGGQSFSPLGSISNLASSPKALPLVAAAAWGNWRKGREGFSNLGAVVGNGSVQQTPSKSSPQSFFAGLMTPPSTNLRTTPPIANNPNSLSSASLAAQTAIKSPTTPRQNLSGRNSMREQREPVIPPLNLMRKASYDLDASESMGRFGDEGVEGNRTMGEDEEPFGPRLGGIVGTM